MKPRVSVILPTYNWSGALRCSIPSVLFQTEERFELLVIGDGCTDDTGDVAASFGDPRVRFHNLIARTASQSGPNNLGLHLASGEYVAYLGHDDLWHPEHLKELLAVIENDRADLACSLCAMYGPPGSGVRGVSGVLIDGEYREEDFLVPTSILHTRALASRIGLWRLPGETRIPVDCDFLLRAHESGARIRSTGRLTAFKFNSAWRRDSYRKRETHEQQAMLGRLVEDPELCERIELAGLLTAGCEKRLIETRMPQPAKTGTHHRVNTRFRGLESEPAGDLAGPISVGPGLGLAGPSIDGIECLGLEWHGCETDPRFGLFRWSGPAYESSVVLPYRAPRRLRLRVELVNTLQVDLLSEVQTSLNETPIELMAQEMEAPLVALSGEADLPAAPNLRITFRIRRTRCPRFLFPNWSKDERWLGICLRGLEITPLEGPESTNQMR